MVTFRIWEEIGKAFSSSWTWLWDERLAAMWAWLWSWAVWFIYQDYWLITVIIVVHGIIGYYLAYRTNLLQETHLNRQGQTEGVTPGQRLAIALLWLPLFAVFIAAMITFFGVMMFFVVWVMIGMMAFIATFFGLIIEVIWRVLTYPFTGR